jgi:DUF971 family protein
MTSSGRYRHPIAALLEKAMNQTLASKESLGRLPSLNTSARSKPAQIKPPQQVRLRRAQKLVELVWPDGHTSQLSCLLLRKSCACSSCARAEQTGQLTLLDADVGVERVELSGVSGLQFYFSDGHYRGLYPWAYLRELDGLGA